MEVRSCVRICECSIDVKVLKPSAIILRAKDQELIIGAGFGSSRAVVQEVCYLLLLLTVMHEFIYQTDVLWDNRAISRASEEEAIYDSVRDLLCQSLVFPQAS